MAVLLSILPGCSTTPPVTIKTEVPTPALARTKSVAVMKDFYMDDPQEAARIAAEVRDFLKRQGYSVKTTELDAELIVIPTLAQSQNAGHVTPSPPRQISLLPSSSFEQPGMTHPGSDFSSFGEVGGFAFDAPEIKKTGLMLSAVTRENWLRAGSEDVSLPRVWRVTAVMETPQQARLPLEKTLLQAMEPALAQITGAAPSPSPATHPR